MRALLLRKSDRFIKTIKTTPFVFEHVLINLDKYRSWLYEVGFRTPDTQVQYADGQIVFKQEFIEAGPCLEVKLVVNKIRRLSFDKYGLDSNPNNFLGSNDLYFVDFFPLLTRDPQILKQQFSYSPKEALRRYFTLENILACYVARLFKCDVKMAMDALKQIIDLLIAEYETILPREKIRLLRALQFSENNQMSKYPQAYIDSKGLTLIGDKENAELKDRLNHQLNIL